MSLIVKFYVVADHCINFSSAVIHTHTLLLLQKQEGYAPSGVPQSEYGAPASGPAAQAPQDGYGAPPPAPGNSYGAPSGGGSY